MPRRAAPMAPFSRGTALVWCTFLNMGMLNTIHHTPVNPKMNERQTSISTPTAFMIRNSSSGMVEPPI